MFLRWDPLLVSEWADAMAASAFSGGLKFNAALNFLKTQLSKEQLVRVGFLEGATCGPDNDAPAPEIAFILEGGAPVAGIPPRPFFRNMILRNSPKWGKVLAAFLKKNKYNVELSLMGTGLIMGEQLQLEITMTTTPANTDAVAKAKGFNKPLEWSKNLKRSIAAEVGGNRKESNGSA